MKVLQELASFNGGNGGTEGESGGCASCFQLRLGFWSSKGNEWLVGVLAC